MPLPGQTITMLAARPTGPNNRGFRPMSTITSRPAPGRRKIDRGIGAVMGFAAATLAVASFVHLVGDVHGRSDFNPDAAGIAEAIIGAALACGAIALVRAPAWGRAVALAATGFAIFGFVVGLTFTARAGDIPDIAYHSTMLPVLIGSLTVLLRTANRGATSALATQRR